MATGKRYYWMKLKESFMTSDIIDYFMEQPDGANYVVLYQMLCLKTINTEGRLSRQIGEIIIPYDVEKSGAIASGFLLIRYGSHSSCIRQLASSMRILTERLF